MILSEIILHPEELKSGQQVSFKYKENELDEWIKIHCSEFLKLAGNYELYRGIRSEKRKVFLGYPRDNRKPVEKWSAAAAEKTDRLLKAARFSARRSNSIFCNSDAHLAFAWGTVYKIYPINGFTFGYSKKYTGSNAMAYFLDEDYEETMSFKSGKEFITYNKIMKTDLRWPLVHHFDIWIHGSYVAVNYNYEE